MRDRTLLNKSAAAVWQVRWEFVSRGSDGENKHKHAGTRTASERVYSNVHAREAVMLKIHRVSSSLPNTIDRNSQVNNATVKSSANTLMWRRPKTSPRAFASRSASPPPLWGNSREKHWEKRDRCINYLTFCDSRLKGSRGESAASHLMWILSLTFAV